VKGGEDRGDGRARPGSTLLRLVAGHLAVVITEWASMVAVLVYAFDRGGAKATGLASLALLAPQLVSAPISAALTSAHPPQRVRLAGMAVEAVGYGLAAAAATAGEPVALVVLPAVVALGAVTTLRPTGAVLLPGLVRSTGELTQGNLWVGYAESLSALLGPLAAAGLLALGGAETALAGCAALAALAFVLTFSERPLRRYRPVEDGAWRPGRALSGALDTMRTRPWTIGILGVITARSAVVGFLDVTLVVLAFEELDLGQGGPGLLSALVGGGALLSSLVVTGIVHRSRLAPWLTIGLGAASGLCLVLGLATDLAVAVVVLPVLGLTSTVLYGLGTILLQRSADPRVLGSLFAMIELVGGVGLLLGSGLAQVLIAVGGVELALAGMAVVLLAVLLVTGRGLRRADDGADVPVVEMSVLQALPMFASLPPLELEAVARSAETVDVADGEVVIHEGDVGDRFYAVADGSFAIVMRGRHIRDARRGSCFGEVALLADVARTATVSATGAGRLLAVDRQPFLVAVTGRESALAAAWEFVQSMPVAPELPDGPVAAADDASAE
jgi:MFS family permease